MQTANLSVPLRIPFGTPIIYSNLWTDFKTDRFNDQFKWLSGQEVGVLAIGTIVYVDIDPLHPNGKVYGSVKGQITAVTPSRGCTMISYVCEGFVQGSRRIEYDAQYTGFALAVDEDKLADILDELPKAKVIDDLLD